MRKLLPSQSYTERLLFLLKLHWVFHTENLLVAKEISLPKSPAGLGTKNQFAVMDSILTTRFPLSEA